MMELAFREFDTRTFFAPGDIVAEAEVFGGRDDAVPLTINADVTFTLHRQQLDRAKAVVAYTGPLKAPVREGDQMAVLKLTIPGEGTTEYPLYAAKTARELTILQKMGLGVKLLFTPPTQTVP